MEIEIGENLREVLLAISAIGNTFITGYIAYRLSVEKRKKK